MQKSTRHITDDKFIFNQDEMSITDKYTYLGTTINSQGMLTPTKDELYKKATKAFFKLHKSLSGKPPPPHIYNNFLTLLLNQFFCTTVKFGDVN